MKKKKELRLLRYTLRLAENNSLLDDTQDDQNPTLEQLFVKYLDGGDEKEETENCTLPCLSRFVTLQIHLKIRRRFPL